MSLYSSLTQVFAPFASKINGLLTGWDGTKYSTPGEAVRQQISDLHVLIGDEPGTAIQASAIAYGDSNVADELTGINGRLTQLNYTIINNDLLRAATWHKGFVKVDGTLTQATTDKTYNYTDMIPVEEGERYKYALDSSSGRLIIAAYENADDERAVTQKSVRGTDGMASGTYVVPNGVKYIRVTLRVADYASQYLYKRTSLTDISSAVTLLDTSIGDLSKLETETKTDLVAAINEAVQTGSGSGLTPEISTAILNCFQHVAWTSADGLAHYTALRVLLFPVTITVYDNVMSVENADEITSVSKDGMTLILL